MSATAAVSETLQGQLKTKWPFLAAVGAGCLVGASGLLLVQHLSRRVGIDRGHDVSRELTALHFTIRDLQEAVNELKEAKTANGRPLRSALRTVTFADVESSLQEKVLSPVSQLTSNASSTTEFYSAISSEDEYQDIPDDDDQSDSLPVIFSSPEDSSDAILELFRVFDDLCMGMEEEQSQALILLKKYENELGENSEFLWRLCKAMYLKANILGAAGENDMKKKLVFESKEVGSRAVKANENNAEAHKWYAIAVGSCGEFVGVKEKIIDGYEFKKHIEIASELAPQDHTIQHLLGRFCFEIAELSWWERKMASTLFAEPPMATTDEALEHFLEAENLKPEGWKENRIFIAKCLMKLQRHEEAVKWLNDALKLPCNHVLDKHADANAEELLATCQSSGS